MKFFSLAIVAGLFCAVAVSAAPSSMNVDDSMIIDVDGFSAAEDINKAIQVVLEKIKCSLPVIGKVLSESELKKDYVEYKSAVENILQNDLKKCADLDGVESKLKCGLNVAQKLFKLTADFTYKVEKSNKGLAEKLTKALKRECFKRESNLFEMHDDISEIDIHDELTFGLTDTVTKILQALLRKAQCSLKAIQQLVLDSDLLDIFKEFKDDVENVLKTDAQKCLQVEGLAPKLKCALAVSEKLTKLFAGFAQNVLKENKDLGGRVIKAITQCVQKNVELLELNDESMDDEVEAFDLAATIKRVLEELKKRIRCSINAVEVIIGDGELKGVFTKFRADLESLLKNDAKQCVKTKGVLEKMKCIVTVTQKLNTLYANFVKEVRKTNKEVAKKIVGALRQCLRGGPGNSFISNDDDVVFVDAADVVKKIIQATIEKVKCSLNSIEALIKNAELKKVYDELKSAVEDILQNDFKKCADVEGLKEKLTCALSATQKLTKAYSNFINQVLNIDKKLAKQIVEAVEQCLKN